MNPVAADEGGRTVHSPVAPARPAPSAADVRDRLEFLIEASNAVGGALDLQERLDALARLGVPRFADGCAVHLVDDDGVPALIAVHHRDASQQGVLRDLLSQYPIRMDSPIGVARAINEGATSWLPTITEEHLQAAASSAAHLDSLRALDISAGLSVPLAGRAGIFGAVTFFTVGDRRIDDDDVVLAEELCARVAVHVRNGQLLESRELDRSANRYQAALLRSLFEASVDGILAVDANGGVLAYNRRFLDLWGFDETLTEIGDEALLAAAVTKVADPDWFIRTVREAYAELPAQVRDDVFLTDGRILDRHGTRLGAEDGEHLGFTWSFRDITSERHHQAEIAAAGERFAAVARTLQHSLLPPRLPSPLGVDLAARYHPALAGLEVGGDFYDVFAVGDDWMLTIGDVCGKGAEAASVTALVRFTIRAAATHDDEPSSILRELNAAMLASGTDDEDARFATVCCIRLRSGPDGVIADVACGGHPPPVILRADGTTTAGGTAGTLMGVVPTVEITTTSTALDDGDVLVAVTDGVLEARDHDGAQLDAKGLEILLAGMRGHSANEISLAVEAHALDVQGGTARDDIAVLVARIVTPADRSADLADPLTR